MPLHITQRGHNKMQCFFDDDDRRLYLGVLGELARKFGCDLHAFVLMTNHVHLLATPRDEQGASLMMKGVGQRYASHINRRFNRCGSLWQGRFHSNVVDSEHYLLCCYRYIELNPVRAGMVGHPASYPWSSYAANALGEPSLLLTPHERYLMLAEKNDDRQAAYRHLVASGVEEADLIAIRMATRNGRPLGSDDFVRRFER